MSDYDQKRIYRWSDVSPHFERHEVMSPNTIMHPHLIDIVALHQLNEFRNKVNKPLFINHRNLHLRGVRSATEQISLEGIGGAFNSQHVQGKAFDISCYDLKFKDFLKLCEDFWPFVKAYPDKNFIHCDNRNLITV